MLHRCDKLHSQFYMACSQRFPVLVSLFMRKHRVPRRLYLLACMLYTTSCHVSFMWPSRRFPASSSYKYVAKVGAPESVYDCTPGVHRFKIYPFSLSLLFSPTLYTLESTLCAPVFIPGASCRHTTIVILAYILCMLSVFFTFKSFYCHASPTIEDFCREFIASNELHPRHAYSSDDVDATYRIYKINRVYRIS